MDTDRVTPKTVEQSAGTLQSGAASIDELRLYIAESIGNTETFDSCRADYAARPC
ncbi:hypothetical protein [Pararobbsia alpina]|uniref:Uncharacterized protein n=1 Tax=Pararobbsia alpina TaxID=621374 RepID=A0A6S7CCM9_9BURK|nr:hypothetical protein [Pararobbsia alpina]CAB3806197.1 hypothetical protein LMG28138_05776 [Pararobbsia alpina]